MRAPKSFEDGMARLETILSQMQSEETTLTESVKLYAEAASLMEYCHAALEKASLQMEEIDAARSEGISSAIFAVASVVAIITMHDAMGVRHETGEQAKVLNQMIEEWIDISEKNAPFLQNMHLKEMVGHTPLQVMAGMVVGVVVGFLYPMHL